MAASINSAFPSASASQENGVPTNRASTKIPDKIDPDVCISSTSDSKINERSVVMTRNRFVADSIHHYKVTKTICEGTYAKVKLMEHMSSGEKLAVKIINKSDLNANRMKRLFREIRIMKMLQHPNVVQLFEVFETDKSLYLAMEFLPGGDLYDYVYDKYKLDEKEARTIFRQIVSGLDYCHQRGIMHRDLKLENILMDSEMNIKICDFGMSTNFLGDNKLSTPCGTPAYLAPEILLGEKYGIGADVWSMGVILYYLVTGYVPFDDSSLALMTKQVLLCNFEIPDSVSSECKTLIRKVLVLNPAERATLKSIMEDEWINKEYETTD